MKKIVQVKIELPAETTNPSITVKKKVILCTKCSVCFVKKMDLKDHILENHLKIYLLGGNNISDCLKVKTKRREKSFMWKHASNEHNGEEKDVKFDMKVERTFIKTIKNNFFEAISINVNDPKVSLNSKAEFHQPSVTRRYLQNIVCKIFEQ